MTDPGMVYLVGAGPGAPGLLTTRGLELLRNADVVAHDLLVPPGILALASSDAELLAVGRRAGHPTPDYKLHSLVLDRARAGKRVVRLKAGDPLVFGRGAEEAEVLSEAGIPFEIVPGVSAALGAAACAGIPLTDRRVSSGVMIATGHQIGDGACDETVVLYMVSRRLAENIRRLLSAGRSPKTPAAYVASASRPGQQVIVGTLADLVEQVEAHQLSGPALLIVGDVVTLREKIQWFEGRPLRGNRILVGRARPGRSQIAAGLRDAGAEVVEWPQVSVEPPENWDLLDRAIRRWEDFDAVMFGSAAGVDGLLSRLTVLGMDVRDLPSSPLLAVGRQATERLLARGLRPAQTYPGACENALAAQPEQVEGLRLLLVTSEDGRPNLRALLGQLGSDVTAVPAYRHRRRYPTHPLGPIDLVVLPSSSAARHLLQSFPLADRPTVAIGPQTASAARNLGARHVVLAQTDTVEAVIERALHELRSADRLSAKPR